MQVRQRSNSVIPADATYVSSESKWRRNELRRFPGSPHHPVSFEREFDSLLRFKFLGIEIVDLVEGRPSIALL